MGPPDWLPSPFASPFLSPQQTLFTTFSLTLFSFDNAAFLTLAKAQSGTLQYLRLFLDKTCSLSEAGRIKALRYLPSTLSTFALTPNQFDLEGISPLVVATAIRRRMLPSFPRLRNFLILAHEDLPEILAHLPLLSTL